MKIASAAAASAAVGVCGGGGEGGRGAVVGGRLGGGGGGGGSLSLPRRLLSFSFFFGFLLLLPSGQPMAPPNPFPTKAPTQRPSPEDLCPCAMIAVVMDENGSMSGGQTFIRDMISSIIERVADSQIEVVYACSHGHTEMVVRMDWAAVLAMKRVIMGPA